MRQEDELAEPNLAQKLAHALGFNKSPDLKCVV